MKVLKTFLLLLALLLCIIITASRAWGDVASIVVVSIDIMITLIKLGMGLVTHNPRASVSIILVMIIWSVVIMSLFESISEHLSQHKGNKASSASNLAQYEREQNDRNGYWGPLE